ncbi:Glycosyl transferase family 2 [compost metagenome]
MSEAMALLSIIVPTHNRARYAIETVKSLLALSDEIQVVVCDSSPVDNLSAEFEGLYAPSRLKLVRAHKEFSVVDNFNLGLASADGEYLVFIGDDDFVAQEIVDVVGWAKQGHIDALKFSFPALYYWDDFKHSTLGDLYSGTLHVSPFTGVIKKHDAKKASDYALKHLGGGVFDMPRAYAGMISSDLARRIVAKYGALFGGVSPDIYSAFLISREARSCVMIDYPIIIPGASGLSTSGQSSSGGHYGKLRENAHIAPFKNLVWDSRVPEFYSVPTVWSYSLVKAVEKVTSEEGTSFKPNFGRLLVRCFAYYPRSFKESSCALLEVVKSLGVVATMAQIASSLKAEFIWGVSRIYNRVKRKGSSSTVEVVNHLQTSREASEALQDYLAAKKIKIVLTIAE